MIIGHGFIASALHDVKASGAIYHAAGVSNSRCVDPAAYARDRALLRKTLKMRGDVVYFSSCAVLFEDTQYVTHKRHAEAEVLDRDGTVLRISNAVGRDAPAHLLLPFLAQRMGARARLTLQRNATRNLIDVLDVARLAVKYRKHGGIVNICTQHAHPVRAIVRALAAAMHRDAVYDLTGGGVAHEPIPHPALIVGPHYLETLLDKYYGHRVPARAAVA